MESKALLTVEMNMQQESFRQAYFTNLCLVPKCSLLVLTVGLPNCFHQGNNKSWFRRLFQVPPFACAFSLVLNTKSFE
jgi:hypothetical protein